MQEIYDEDYFERGLVTGKSCYVNYRWLPELTIPMAMTMIDLLEIKRGDSILDFGTAKGFLVKAFRMLHRKAWGVDISRYAIENVDLSVKDYCFLVEEDKMFDAFDMMFDFCIAKDVFEHIEKDKLINILKSIPARILFAIIPLGENGKYRIPAYELDITHVIREDEDWWLSLFGECGWNFKNFFFRVKGIKDNWAKFRKGNGFFILRKEDES